MSETLHLSLAAHRVDRILWTLPARGVEWVALSYREVRDGSPVCP